MQILRKKCSCSVTGGKTAYKRSDTKNLKKRVTFTLPYGEKGDWEACANKPITGVSDFALSEYMVG
eukprot:3123685-Rhodomonas_salina.1